MSGLPELGPNDRLSYGVVETEHTTRITTTTMTIEKDHRTNRTTIEMGGVAITLLYPEAALLARSLKILGVRLHP